MLSSKHCFCHWPAPAALVQALHIQERLVPNGSLLSRCGLWRFQVARQAWSQLPVGIDQTGNGW
jgi:hypothetical protein